MACEIVDNVNFTYICTVWSVCVGCELVGRKVLCLQWLVHPATLELKEQGWLYIAANI